MGAKRTVDEILLICETEPSLVDVFCEGAFDAGILDQFVGGLGAANTSVYFADQIEWPDELDDDGGNRKRVIFLSEQLSALAVNGICVIDRDLDTIQDATAVNANLLKTDYSCIDMYSLDVDDLVVLLYSRYNIVIEPEQIGQILDACKAIFSVRYLRDKHCAGASIATPEKIIQSAKELKFSVQNFLERCKQRNGYDSRWDHVFREQDELLRSMVEDIRCYINVHDFGEILSIIVRSLKSKSVSLEPEFLSRHLAYRMLSQSMFGFPLFSEISTRLPR